ncbi:glucans biosynthesis glucosyltransferase MdoH [Bombella saccharophila]|uniref:Glucans biosynthesis glucosyltransferase H n=1 Tax=Bombella saccharophila TaxID=2967338 RepID=A0ABT3W9A0_9PROT|nr:glucans biosynthesis glucosyltransferase MdoH [Bombella saccharophila]MCX5615228.1 glucans biosynthesis glucosyltransferase MdoH [Bombella saccharophila]
MALPLDRLINPMTSPHITAFLPPESPLSMPVQSLHKAPERHGRAFWRLPSTPTLLWLRRLFVFGTTFALTAYSVAKINAVFNSLGTSLLGMVMLGLFTILSFWISLSCASALGGFWSMLRHGGLGLGIRRTGPLPELKSRTAILLPTYNEPPQRVMLNLRAMLKSLQETGRGEHFDIFILSDTTNPDIWVQEEQAVLDLHQHAYARQHLFYRRRFKNTDRKAGNIADWVTRFGGAYPAMLTLDADSLMDGSLIVRMAAAMEQHEQVGLIQSLPVIVGGQTLFARLQQFAGRVYGPLIAQGIAWWHGSEGNYWGHNAIIRTQAFAEQAGLPHLRGKPPFGGHILSHDFIEAALMRRGGWAIHMVPGLMGSYEESPPSLTDIAVRDRRWCQGNLQHARILFTKGMHWVSRSHMLVGIGSYIMSPLWLLFLLFGILIALQAHFYHPEYFSTQRSLYPHWPHVDPILARLVFIQTMVVLLAPKALAFLAICFDKQERQQAGGVIRLSISIILETLLGALIAPIAMLIQTSAILSILLGRDSGWSAQNRDDGSLPWGDTIRKYWLYSLFGLVLSAAAWSVSLALFLWMLPVLVGLLIAIPLVGLTGSRVWGTWARKAGLLLIPEETTPPSILQRAAEERNHPHPVILEAFHALRSNTALRHAHLATLPPPRKAGEPISVPLLTGSLKLQESPTLEIALARLTPAEKAAVLSCQSNIAILADLPVSSPNLTDGPHGS